MDTDASESTCTHVAFTCVTCKEVQGIVKIRVQSNNMPQMCWQTSTGNPNVASYQIVDFSVTWNKDMTGVVNYPASSWSTQDDTTNILCDISRTNEANLPADINYSENGSSIGMQTVAGFGRTNIALYNGLAAGNADAVLTELSSMDKCVSHAPKQGVQHAHSITPCMNGGGITGSTTEKPG